KEAVANAGLGARCELYRGGCYGLCHLGANVVVREDNGRKKDPFSPEDFQLMGWEDEYHYQEMTPEKVARVVAEHIAADKPVADFVAPPDDSVVSLKSSS
ncbi:MAG TPA: (2Fe-2S) ferredoxin domain-containing protein, partial [Myxococcaceae bacterium]|nr:(2Fe-2S) ferredoxin domain-containing protein [Myxococcaceae bacterium]